MPLKTVLVFYPDILKKRKTRFKKKAFRRLISMRQQHEFPFV